MAALHVFKQRGAYARFAALTVEKAGQMVVLGDLFLCNIAQQHNGLRRLAIGHENIDHIHVQPRVALHTRHFNVQLVGNVFLAGDDPLVHAPEHVNRFGQNIARFNQAFGRIGNALGQAEERRLGVGIDQHAALVQVFHIHIGRMLEGYAELFAADGNLALGAHALAHVEHNPERRVAVCRLRQAVIGADP
ncbi:hypothetical protein SDC9_157420 [bioreactor metagenome]|uniref:Uncharacterized protein n=1 Tax=bioreactor metagenome TaxID=1076179 RepID=A0A645F7D3_9ZZZZ